MIEKIDLTNYSNRFNTPEMIELGKVNFVFGKNGTGKSTITQAIEEQYHENGYDVRIYDGHSRIFGENERLDAIALGEKNVKIMNEIEKIDVSINDYKSVLENYDQEGNLDGGLLKEKKEIRKKHQKQEAEINDFYTASARKIRKSSNPVLVNPGSNYDKNSFKKEIPQAELLTAEQFNTYTENISATFLELENCINFPLLNPDNYFSQTTDLLKKTVSPSIIIKNLENDKFKKEFANQGMLLHSHEDTEGNIIRDQKCAFCDNVINEDRWKELDQYFSYEVNAFSEEVENFISNLTQKITTLETITTLDPSRYHPAFRERVRKLNQNIKSTANSNIIYINKLIESLKDKKNNLTEEKTLVNVKIPEHFKGIQTEYELLYTKNKDFNENIDYKKSEAQKILRHYQVYISLNKFDFEEKLKNLNDLKNIIDEKDNKIKVINENIYTLDEQKKELIAQTKSEEKLAKEISELLNTLGEISFSLELIEDDDEANGQYKILDDNNNLRNITEVSEGEKNIIAFLYFMKSLENTDDTNTKPKIIILDDPMSSNDNTYQYLIIGIIKEFYGNLNTNALMDPNDMLVVLTHSTYFYINVSPFRKKHARDLTKRNKEARYYKLIKKGKRSSIVDIIHKDKDISTSYNLLWDELKYAHENNRPKVMWNIMRRILETFAKFNNIALKELLTDNFDNPIEKILGQTMQTSLNDNSHAIIDSNFDADFYSVDDLINFFEKIFDRKLSINHFNKYMS